MDILLLLFGFFCLFFVYCLSFFFPCQSTFSGPRADSANEILDILAFHSWKGSLNAFLGIIGAMWKGKP